MNIVLLIIVYGYALVAGLVIWYIFRDRKNPKLFFGRYKFFSGIFIAILAVGILTVIYSTLTEPFILKTTSVALQNSKINNLKIALISDIQVGNHKKTAWVEKIVARIESANPDLVIFGGDLIDNEATFEDESQYLEPLRKLIGKFSMYYVLGNHEYGIGGTVRNKPEKYTGDRSQLLIDRMKTLGIPLLRNTLDCPEIKGQKICLFGIDDIWKYKPNFSDLKNWDNETPLIYITHNPDGILYYPTNLPAPDLILAGHTHGGQIWIPFFGPLGDAQIILGKSFYRGLNYFHNIPIYTSVGAGESGAPLRLFARPEIVLLNID
ncbi:MAG: metallophosphoesterase [Candidatus Magasanikbacteria bacterium]|nr:metallophosphoesterase [Candidatus Magasanikbacteria bacterium]